MRNKLKISDKMKIAIVSGKDEGPTKLNAFDNALSDAGGAMVNCVLSEITSDKPGDQITAVIAVAIGEELGCVVETTGINKDADDLLDEAKMMVEYMMEKRDVEIKDLLIESSTAVVENIASVVASVIYLNDEIIEE